MNIKTVLAAVAALAMTGLTAGEALKVAEKPAPAAAQTTATQPETQEVKEGEEADEEETPIVSATFSFAIDSRYLSYGFVDNKDPIMTPSVEINFLDWVNVGCEMIMDMTKYGRHAGYGSHAFNYTEIHPYVEIRHTFDDKDLSFLPTAIELAAQYQYEYHNKDVCQEPGDGADEDTHFAILEVGLPELWLEPVFSWERDLYRDEGSYFNLEVGHTWEDVMCEGLTIRPSVAQGYGNRHRVAAYASTPDGEPMNRMGFMDTLLKIDVEYAITDWLTVGGYVGYSDFLFDRHIREAARSYEATGRYDYSWNFIWGLAVTASF